MLRRNGGEVLVRVKFLNFSLKSLVFSTNSFIELSGIRIALPILKLGEYCQLLQEIRKAMK